MGRSSEYAGVYRAFADGILAATLRIMTLTKFEKED